MALVNKPNTFLKISWNIQDNFGTQKRNLDSQYLDSVIANENLSTKKKYAIQKKLSADDPIDSVACDTIHSLASSLSRPPLIPLDINSRTDDMQPIWNRGPNQITRNQAWTANAKAKRKAL